MKAMQHVGIKMSQPDIDLLWDLQHKLKMDKSKVIRAAIRYAASAGDAFFLAADNRNRIGQARGSAA